MSKISFAKLFDRESLQSSVGQTSYEHIEGTIEWDEENQGKLPKIVTDEKEWKWLDLGRELMRYEGFKIKIEIN